MNKQEQLERMVDRLGLDLSRRLTKLEKDMLLLALPVFQSRSTMTTHLCRIRLKRGLRAYSMPR